MTPSPGQPVVGLAAGVHLTPLGLVRDGRVIARPDPLLAAVLVDGLPIGEAGARAPELERLQRLGLLELRVAGLLTATPLAMDSPLPDLAPAVGEPESAPPRGNQGLGGRGADRDVGARSAGPDAGERGGGSDLATRGRPDAAGGNGVPVVVPVDPGAGPAPLSRFAVLRREDQAWVLESGLSPWRLTLTDAGVTALADPSSAGRRAAGFLAVLGACGLLAEHDEDPAIRLWEPHDLLFARRSRPEPAAIAGSRLRTVREVAPARRKNAPVGPRIPLPVPTGPEPDEPSLWDVTRTRRSRRAFGDKVVPVEVLGTLLWRTLRVVRVEPADPDDAASYDRVFRPVPSGGAMHGSDLWLLCMGVAGVPTGAWWYDPEGHALVGLGAPSAALSQQLERAEGMVSGRLGLLGLLTVRHARAAGKYAGIAYALELKDIGVILHAVQLTAEALGLGMCPLGSGPTLATAGLLGLDPAADAPIGEFLLGVRPS